MSERSSDITSVQDKRLNVFRSVIPPKEYFPLYREGTYQAEEDLKARVNRDLTRRRYAPERVVYEFTKDPGLLHQYYMMRELQYSEVWGYRHYIDHQDSYDEVSHILVARIDNLVIAGARLTPSFPNDRHPLSLEDENFQLEKALPELPLEKVPYGEFSRLAVLQEYRTIHLLEMLYRHMNAKSVELGLQYVFAVAPLLQARNTRRLVRNFSLHYTLREDIMVPDRELYDGKKMIFAIISHITVLDNPLKTPMVLREEQAHLEDAQ